MTALRTIEAELTKLAQEADEGHGPDGHVLRIIARKVAAQAEMAEQGLAE